MSVQAADPGFAANAGGGRQRFDAARSPFVVVMGVVAVVAAIYYAFIAAPMYVSEARFSIRSQQAAAPTTLLAGLSGKSTGLADITAVQDHLLSHEMLSALESRFHLRQSYSTFRPDLFHWLPPGSSEEALLRFYRRMIIVKLDREAEIVEINVRSFDHESAPAIAAAILEQTEAFVDGMTQRSRAETMRSAQTELDRARLQAVAARLAVSNFRGASSSVDPKIAGAQMQGSQAALENQAAAAQAELASALTFNRADSPVVRQLRARLASLQAQAGRLRADQGAGGGGRQVTDYETLVIQRESAEQKLVAANTAFDTARATAQQREKYVVRVVNPSQPDRPTAPKRLLDFLTVMVFALAGYAIISLAVAGIRDHRGV